MSKAEWLYGIHTVSAVLKKHPDRVLEMKVQEGRDERRLDDVLKRAQQLGVSVQYVNKKSMDHQFQDANHQGLAARCRLANALDEHGLFNLLDRIEGPPFLLILDSVTDPHNLGAVLRSADAAGVHAVITTKDKSVGLTPVVRRVAVGAAEVMPFVQVTNLARLMKQLQERRIWIVGTELDETATSLYQTDLKGPLALVMGAEGPGLRRLTRENCDQLVYIPMQGDVQSLNVSVAAGVCLFESLRQRLS
ncbi:23S rRNA (guanosine(2251)-2'-O)-methyltransferase RlmB [Ketobacter sp.]|uniref:23S rRNA (guanosine(2251)-2'-O)-methyltransferase RlmB n=1 Tax=Ketobacter sp. TaxID=2083498 RepID=UPI000C6516CF|nr:23S rRNA (guanosine(2251)-2'-O)-methyltransferase RlmB [Ketobacter sp.]MBA54518.1 23S rRNA (guanosine(2251)-2'-O)-methyltransferase RlmB [Pseudomonadales bacterium]RLT94374.1 MAG: 23S rRNA (guanosine(2251)-2'-O)-methyltransferase RlmB [Ketobacter sp.]RLU03903.1 MAG: 23S rRNA (guanosine(2251)-2'-O)-methyltransferase RlmB [Ketobacter sp.]